MAVQNEDLPDPSADLKDDPPPFLGSWRRVYIAVLCYLGALIGVLYALTQYFRR